ncbi:MAG: lasso peptide biosynthesis B2 protein [Sedimentisphaerales bacterium]
MKLYRNFLSLSPDERKLFIQVSFTLIAFRAALRLIPFKKLLRLIDRFKPAPVSTDLDALYKERYVRAVSRAGNHVLRNNVCLPQALAVYTMLKRHGESAQLQIGVRKDDRGDLKAHAWVENRGQVLIGGVGIDLERYVKLHGLNGVVV